MHELVRTVLYLHKQLERAADGLADGPANDGPTMTTSQYHMLHFLHEEPRRASEFMVVSKLRKPGITALVAGLEARGWVERAPDPDDGRAQLVRITPVGLGAFHDFEAAMQASLESFLGTDTVRHADAAMATLYAAWNRRRVKRFNDWRNSRRDATDGKEGTDGEERVDNAIHGAADGAAGARGHAAPGACAGR